MASKWVRPELGQFKYDGSEWVGRINLPAFDLFVYGTRRRKARGTKGRYELTFEGEDESDAPSPAAVALARKVLANEAALAPKVMEAIWKDFNGQGPDSGMWWHGDLDQVADMMLEEDPPSRQEELLKLMRLSQVRIRKSVDGSERAIVELVFAAAFEEEHDIGVLTNGKAILGIGYSFDITPFDAS